MRANAIMSSTLSSCLGSDLEPLNMRPTTKSKLSVVDMALTISNRMNKPDTRRRSSSVFDQYSLVRSLG